MLCGRLVRQLRSNDAAAPRVIHHRGVRGPKSSDLNIKLPTTGDFFQLTALITTALAEPTWNLPRNVKRELEGLRIWGHRSAHNRYYLATKPDIDKYVGAYREAVEAFLHLAGTVVAAADHSMNLARTVQVVLQLRRNSNVNYEGLRPGWVLELPIRAETSAPMRACVDRSIRSVICRYIVTMK